MPFSKEDGITLIISEPKLPPGAKIAPQSSVSMEHLLVDHNVLLNLNFVYSDFGDFPGRQTMYSDFELSTFKPHL